MTDQKNGQEYLSFVLEKLQARLAEISQSLLDGQKEIENMHDYYWQNYTEMDQYGYEDYDNQQALLHQVNANQEQLLLRSRFRKMLDSPFFGRVDFCYDGETALELLGVEHYDLVLLDAMLPGLDGFSLLQQLRAGGETVPVLMLTARSDLSDRVRGLDCGADYYLTKPFETEELLACIRSLLRRGGETADSGETCFGDLRLQRATFLLACGERSVRLSRREYDLMELLMRNGSQIVSKEQLILKVWGYDSAAEDNNVEVYISFLRRKLTHLHSRVRIKTLRMVGYCLEEVTA